MRRPSASAARVDPCRVQRITHGPQLVSSPDLTPLVGVARGPGNPGLCTTLPHVLPWRRGRHSVVLSGLRVRLSIGLCTSVPHHRANDLGRAPRPVSLLRRPLRVFMLRGARYGHGGLSRNGLYVLHPSLRSLRYKRLGFLDRLLPRHGARPDRRSTRAAPRQ